MASAYERLSEERKRLAARIAKIDEMLVRYDELEREAVSLFDGVVPSERRDVNVQPGTGYATGEGAVPTVTPTPMPEFERKLRELMESIDHPVSRSELKSQLNERGVVIGGANELNTLGTRLSRLRWVTNIKNFGYWLEDRDYAPANYQAGAVMRKIQRMAELVANAKSKDAG